MTTPEECAARYKELMETIVAVKGEHYATTLSKSVVLFLITRSLANNSANVDPQIFITLGIEYGMLLNHYAQTAGSPAVDVSSEDFIKDSIRLADTCTIVQ